MIRMKSFIKKEFSLIGILILPFIYLAYFWSSLPQKVPIHWNYEGEIDRWGSKTTLLLIVVLVTLVPYGLMLIIPKIDPKNKLSIMGGKYYKIKFVLVAFMSGLSLFMIYCSKNQSISNPNLIQVVIGVLFIVLGNYFKVIKQNYFIGIKTPWTLENEQVWKLTHIFAGKLWIAGGLIIAVFSSFLPSDLAIGFFLIITILITLIPVLYSYFKYKELK